MKSKKSKTPFDNFLDYLDEIFQEDCERFYIESLIEGIAGVSVFIYRDLPEKGMITAVTYGLSLVSHKDWTYRRPELMILVNSNELEWGLVIGYLANKLRGDCPFSYGNTINLREKIADDSEMDAFLIFAPSIFDKEYYSGIDIGADYKISLGGIYPIYSTEMDLVDNWGLEEFWHHPDFSMYDVNRKRIISET